MNNVQYVWLKILLHANAIQLKTHTRNFRCPLGHRLEAAHISHGFFPFLMWENLWLTELLGHRLPSACHRTRQLGGASRSFEVDVIFKIWARIDIRRAQFWHYHPTHVSWKWRIVNYFEFGYFNFVFILLERILLINVSSLNLSNQVRQ